MHFVDGTFSAEGVCMNCNNHMTGSLPVHTMYTTDRLILKILTPDDTNEVLAFQCRNRELFERYEPTRPPYFLTPAHQQAILKCEYDLARKCASIRFYVFLKTNPRIIIGTVCLHDILRMPYCCSEIGYKFDAAFQHQGYAREAVAKVLNIAFTDLAPRVCPRDAGKYSLSPAFGSHRLHL